MKSVRCRCDRLVCRHAEPFSPWVDIPNIGPVFGHEDAYFVGNVAGTIAGMAAGMSIGNIAAGTSSLVACGSLAQKAAKLYTAIDTVAGIANATSNIAAGNASLGDALAFLPVMTVGVQKLRGAPTNCFIAGTLVAVAGVGTADAGPASASKPIEEIQVGDFVWARDEHDPSAPAVLQKVVALYRNTAHDLQTLEVVGEQGSAGPLGQSVQIVATDEHPFYVVDVGWTTADAVQVGQKLVGAGGAVLTVVANRDWKPDGGVVVYNFQVEGDHTYFVGDIHAQGEWVWTHNMCAAGALDGNTAKMAAVRQAGQRGEEAAGIVGRKVGVEGPLSGRMRFPDQYIMGVLIKESKNVVRQGWTSQLKDYAALAKDQGIPFELWVRGSTRLSKPLMKAQSAGDVIIKILEGL